MEGAVQQRPPLAVMIQERQRREQIKQITTRTVIGFVDPERGFTHAILRDNGWKNTDKKPDMFLPAKMERIVKSNKRFKIVIGGRGSAKSISVGDIDLMNARDNLAKTYCLREYQSSIKNSVHSMLKTEIDRLEFSGFEVLQNSISYKGSPVFEFAGLSRNVDSIKSAHGFRDFNVEEAQTVSEDSLRALTPTARHAPNKGLPGDIGEAIQAANVSITFIANPASSQDPFSKRFIVPYLPHLERDGYYEDEMHTIVVMNYTDNPWFMESGLETERKWDFEHRPRAVYDHIWLGRFNDSVDSALILAEWFDACIDAHIKLGFGPRGVKIAAHDPSDGTNDSKGYAMRHGSVVLDIQEKLDGNVNEGGHWAANIALLQGVDEYCWDYAGMGAGLSEQNSKDFQGKKVKLSGFVGAESPDFPDSIYKPAMQNPVAEQRTNEQVFKNKRAQYHWELRDRVYRTYRAVVHHEYSDPDLLISFCSKMPLLLKLRAEVSRIPVKPNKNGLNELYTKEEMRSKFKIASPNLAESVMMALRYVPETRATSVVLPPTMAGIMPSRMPRSR